MNHETRRLALAHVQVPPETLDEVSRALLAAARAARGAVLPTPEKKTQTPSPLQAPAPAPVTVAAPAPAPAPAPGFTAGFIFHTLLGSLPAPMDMLAPRARQASKMESLNILAKSCSAGAAKVLLSCSTATAV